MKLEMQERKAAAQLLTREREEAAEERSRQSQVKDEFKLEPDVVSARAL